MKEVSQNFFAGATPDELMACVKLLALSVSQHREEGGFVALRQSMDQILAAEEEGDDDSTATQLASLGNVLAEEALEIVRIAEAERDTDAEATEEVSDGTVEKRKQFRINVTAPVKVRWPGETDPVSANLENISWGGAAVRVDEVRMNGGETLRLILPKPGGGAISIEAKVLREWGLVEGDGQGMAVRFTKIRAQDEPELEKILELLAQSGDTEGQREHARLTQRLDIHFEDALEIEATLDDISVGGLGITVPDPLQVGQSLQAVISTPDEGCTLKLRARVVRQEPVQLGNMELYQVGLKFEHPTEELGQLTQALLKEMKVPDSKALAVGDPGDGLGSIKYA